MTQPNSDICLYGTREPIPTCRQLTAGPVTAELDNGAIRHIKFGGIEVLRAITFLCRNVNWGTYSPNITALEVRQSNGGFKVTYHARCADDDQSFTYCASISGESDGTLSFQIDGAPENDFATNRLGFCILHPLVGVAGQALQVTHTDGSVAQTTFPETIKPSQPVFDIRVLSHEVCPGVSATCTLLGDAYEMEDQRNWTDASYKTYIRPLSKPFPYSINAGQSVQQSVTLTFSGQPDTDTPAAVSAPIAVTMGSVSSDNVMPDIGLSVDQDTASQALLSADSLSATGVQMLVCQYDMRRSDNAALTLYAKLAQKLGATIMLELIVPDNADPATAAATAAKAVKAAGLEPESVAVSPAAYLMSYQPDAVWPDVPPLESYYTAIRAAFPGVLVGGGMFSYFTELNRKRPPVHGIDYVTHTSCPIVHDADDRSVMETLEALPYVIATTREFMGDLPYRVGPSTIGMRQNPYGAAPAANPDNSRVAMARTDPRHRALFAAAWALGYAAEMVRGGVQVLTPASAVGPAGIVHGQTDTSVPYYDEITDGVELVYPIYHVVRGMADAAGAAVRAVEVSDRTRVQAVAFDTSNGTELWLANLYPHPVELKLQGLTGQWLVHYLDASNFVKATSDHANVWSGTEPHNGTLVTLDALAIARITTR